VVLHDLRVDVASPFIQSGKHDKPVLPAISPQFKGDKNQRYYRSRRRDQFTYIRKIAEVHDCLLSWLRWQKSMK
jgi:hypothetical protein